MSIQFDEIVQSLDFFKDKVTREKTDYGKIWIKELRDAIESGMGRNMLVVGEPGSGKSWACLRLAEVLDANGFTVDKIAFNARDFLQLIMKAKKGDVIVYEEVGVNINNREWHQHGGQNAIMQTVRYKNLFIIMNCPNSDFLDKAVRKLIHYSFMMKKLSISQGYSVMRPMRLHTDGQFNFTKKNYPCIHGDLVSEICVSKPSVKLRHSYEKLARQYKGELNEKFLQKETAKLIEVNRK